MMSRNTLLIYLLIILFVGEVSAQRVDTLIIGSWNLENLFDYHNDPDKNDEEFTPDGNKKWTKERYKDKQINLSKVIRSIKNGKGPDILGVCEVENKAVLEFLIKNYLYDLRYSVVHTESPDERGIDVAILYRKDIFTVLETYIDTVRGENIPPTRVILGAAFRTKAKDTLYVFSNHWPSRRGGEQSEKNRIRSAETLRKRTEKIFSKNPRSSIIVVGDFNDEPDNTSIALTLGASHFECNGIVAKWNNLASGLDKKNFGTYKYRDQWNMLDQIIVSENLIRGGNFKYICESFEIVKPSFMVTPSGKYAGTPTPTFGGNNYLGGYSDHFPVIARFIYRK